LLISQLLLMSSCYFEEHFRTLGRLTSGMTTTLIALGASLGARLVSPPGWYWYLPSEPLSQGIPAIPTDCSDVDLVGVRPDRIDNQLDGALLLR
jgi:hypothetical protein